MHSLWLTNGNLLKCYKRKTVEKLLKVMAILLNDYISLISSAFVSLAAVFFISSRQKLNSQS